MFHKIMELMVAKKQYVALALAVLVVMAYAVPYGMDVEAKKGSNPGKHYGIVAGYGYGLNCDKHSGDKGPLPCRILP